MDSVARMLFVVICLSEFLAESCTYFLLRDFW